MKTEAIDNVQPNTFYTFQLSAGFGDEKYRLENNSPYPAYVCMGTAPTRADVLSQVIFSVAPYGAVSFASSWFDKQKDKITVYTDTLNLYQILPNYAKGTILFTSFNQGEDFFERGGSSILPPVNLDAFDVWVDATVACNYAAAPWGSGVLQYANIPLTGWGGVIISARFNSVTNKVFPDNWEQLIVTSTFKSYPNISARISFKDASGAFISGATRVAVGGELYVIAPKQGAFCDVEIVSNAGDLPGSVASGIQVSASLKIQIRRAQNITSFVSPFGQGFFAGGTICNSSGAAMPRNKTFFCPINVGRNKFYLIASNTSWVDYPALDLTTGNISTQRFTGTATVTERVVEYYAFQSGFIQFILQTNGPGYFAGAFALAMDN